jgi:hypothetical protein
LARYSAWRRSTSFCCEKELLEKDLQICGKGRKSKKAQVVRGQEIKWEMSIKPQIDGGIKADENED